MDNLGDHVLGAGIFRVLRERYPRAHLAAVIPAGLMELYARCPYLDDTLPLPASQEYLRSDAALAQLLQRLREQRRFDWLINPRFAEDWYAAGLLCASLRGASARVLGFRQSYSPIPGFDPNLCYTELMDAPADLHTARYAELIAAQATGGAERAAPEVWFHSEDWARIARAFHLEAKQYVVVGLGASFAYKRPDAAIYQQVIKHLLGASLRVILIGTQSDGGLADLLAQGVARDGLITSTCGRLRLYELSALLAHARLYVGPDAGPKHIAAAAATAVLEISWVPENYPISSRGPGTGGQCWSAWQTLSRSVHPDAAVFAQASARPQFYREPIAGIEPGQIDRALAQLLALTPSASPARSRDVGSTHG